MSLGVSIDMTKDTASAALGNLKRKLQSKRLAAAIGPGCARLTQRHLVGLGPNKKGYPTTNFWAKAAKATSWKTVDGGVLITINQVGVRQRFWGGVIRPVKKKMLAIPISPVSYGRTPSDFPGLFLMVTVKGAYLVQYGNDGGLQKAVKGQRKVNLKGNRKRRREATLHFLFKLTASVTQARQWGVVPPPSAMAAEAKRAIFMLLNFTDKKGGASGQ